jgi:uncharacterized protein
MFKSAIAIAAVFTALALSPVHAEETKLIRSISISGHGEVKAVPDLAVLSIGVTSQATTARDALDANTKSMKALLDILQKTGIEPRDMATSNFSVAPRIDYGRDNNQPGKVVGYDVNNMVMVTVRKIDDLGGLLDVAVTTGSNTISGIAFSVSKPDAMLDEARKAAVADARHKAEIYAAAGGFTLGDIMSLNEATGYASPPPYAAKYSRSEAAADVPIAQGEQALSVDVSISYEIR